MSSFGMLAPLPREVRDLIYRNVFESEQRDYPSQTHFESPGRKNPIFLASKAIRTEASDMFFSTATFFLRITPAENPEVAAKLANTERDPENVSLGLYITPSDTNSTKETSHERAVIRWLNDRFGCMRLAPHTLYFRFDGRHAKVIKPLIERMLLALIPGFSSFEDRTVVIPDKVGRETCWAEINEGSDQVLLFMKEKLVSRQSGHMPSGVEFKRLQNCVQVTF
ncbi:uncharacterized protein KY384_003532 [Bacidia gigantensis]|uniref:uncharacterized protein n=1 Tax=Bacidia gigantensis TaxID=2732470 RepID=UPI001D048E9F|nr:uncharacterized protein KY384_003532 [Bacidia gigantensis]KAG8531896.1 hypothetical protein KY384_003532 [Bacidia gigantensis]